MVLKLKKNAVKLENHIFFPKTASFWQQKNFKGESAILSVDIGSFDCESADNRFFVGDSYELEVNKFSLAVKILNL